MSGSSDSSDDPKIGPRAVRLRQVWEAANMLSAAVQVSKHVSGNTRHSASGDPMNVPTGQYCPPSIGMVAAFNWNPWPGSSESALVGSTLQLGGV